jgi:hypothetical protein
VSVTAPVIRVELRDHFKDAAPLLSVREAAAHLLEHIGDQQFLYGRGIETVNG